MCAGISVEGLLIVDASVGGRLSDEDAGIDDTSVVVGLSDDDSLFDDTSADVEYLSVEYSVTRDEGAVVNCDCDVDTATDDTFDVLGWFSGETVVLADSCNVGCVSAEVNVAEDTRLPLGVWDEYSVAVVSSVVLECVVDNDSVTPVIGVVKSFSDGDTASVDARVVLGCVELKIFWVVLLGLSVEET